MENIKTALPAILTDGPRPFENEHYNGDGTLKTVPAGFKNDVRYWGNSSLEELKEKKSKQALVHQIELLLKSETFGTAQTYYQRKEDLENLLSYAKTNAPEEFYTMRMLDIDYGNPKVCAMKCPHCFRNTPKQEGFTSASALSEENYLSYLGQAALLGAKAFKIIGPAEPLQNSGFLNFLDKVNAIGVGVSVFTKGHVLGSDKLAKAYFGGQETADGEMIDTAERLVQELKRRDVSILLGCNSFNPEMQDALVGRSGQKLAGENYTTLRNNALELLVENGFNTFEEENATRLSLVMAPLQKENAEEAFEIYAAARTMNIYPANCPTAPSGQGKEIDAHQHTSEYINNWLNFQIKTQKWNIEHGITTLEQLKAEKPSLYGGCHPCNQTATGMAFFGSGDLRMCAGGCDDNVHSETYGEKPNVTRMAGGMLEAWLTSSNYKNREALVNEGRINNYCIPRKERSFVQLPVYDRIIDGVERA